MWVFQAGFFFLCKQKTAYEMRISDWSSDVCSSDLIALMNLNHLAIFQAVAAVNSVSGGARRLNISQSAVSKQLAEFERSVGVSLFQRLPRGMRLTEAGRMLQDRKSVV